MKNKGFTLVEVVIAMAITSMLMVLIAGAVRSGVQNKKKTEALLRDEGSAYDALKIIKADLAMAFNYQDFFYEIEKIAIEEANKSTGKKAGEEGSGAGFQVPPRPPKLTQFIGKKDSVHFTSLNNFRGKFNAKESRQMEVGYFVESCTSLKNPKIKSDCLWRRVNKYLDNEVDKDGQKIVILENVEKFELSYIGPNEQDDWTERWRSDNRGRGDQRGKFPNLVKIHLKTTNKADKTVVPVDINAITEIFFPNNENLAKPAPPTPGTKGTPPNGQPPTQ